MISIERKLFEEVDRPTESKIISEDAITKIVERESSWTGEINGTNPFPSGKASGSGTSLIYSNGISMSNWQGIFTAYTGEQIAFKERDVSKNGKFVVLRTYFTDSPKVSWMNFCTVTHWKNGQIVEENLFYDLVGMMRQLGVI